MGDVSWFDFSYIIMSHSDAETLRLGSSIIQEHDINITSSDPHPDSLAKLLEEERRTREFRAGIGGGIPTSKETLTEFDSRASILNPIIPIDRERGLKRSKYAALLKLIRQIAEHELEDDLYGVIGRKR